MILVDTSIWIDFFNEEDSPRAIRLKTLLEQEEDLCLVDVVLTEILQGIRDDALFEKIKNRLFEFPIFSPRDIQTYIQASQIYRLCRKKGVPIRKTIDALIASMALENGLEVFHNDRDFDKISLCTGLKIFKWEN